LWLLFFDPRQAIYLSGSPFINQPWSSDGFGPLDFTLLDHHHGIIDDWRKLVEEIHRRGMYLILDNTIGTMGDLLAMKGYENQTVPFDWDEYDALWKSDRQYLDFKLDDTVNDTCQYPRIWGDDGFLLNSSITAGETGCRQSEFDQYGDMTGVGYVPTWESQLSKFAGVQDRLRLWKPSVLDKVKVFSCMQIAMLDIDGFRVDKALQTPVDELADWADYQRQCARRYNKKNFQIVGEAVGELKFSSIFFGRGKQPDQYWTNLTEAQTASNATSEDHFLRGPGQSALDGAAFHYPTYGAMTRFLGLDGAIGFEGVDFTEHWNSYLLTDDMVNVETGLFDPRHQFGMTNQDTFRWPSLANGTQRQALGFFITILQMPGTPMLLWGEEQEYTILENLAEDYIFGRTPMTASRAFQLHGCYKVGSSQYFNMPWDSALTACHDDNNSLDKRDPSHPLRNLIKRMYELRRVYPVLNDGYTVRSLGFRAHDLFLPGSGQLPSPMGIWSVYRGRTPKIQDFKGQGMGNQGIWMVYANVNASQTFEFDCSSENTTESLIAAFPAGTTVKNLFYPYEEYTLEKSAKKFGIEDETENNGCLPKLDMRPWEYKAFVPVDKFAQPAPVITKVSPRHDARLEASVGYDEHQDVQIQMQFSREMDCDSVTNNMVIRSSTTTGVTAAVNKSSVVCEKIETVSSQRFVGEVGSTFQWTAQLGNVSHGVHTYTLTNATTADGKDFTNAVDTVMFRIGADDNPMVFPITSNYTSGILHHSPSGKLSVSHKAAGADKWQYSTNWGSSFSDWMDYTGDDSEIETQPWSGLKAQEWDGTHIVLHYWSEMTGSADHVQHSDLEKRAVARRWPNMHVQGPWNQYGYDGGLDDRMLQDNNGDWIFDLTSEWPTKAILSAWGMNPNGAPDKTMAFGDVDGDNILDWVPPDSLSRNQINITMAPKFPYTANRIRANDGTYGYVVEPVGNAYRQLAAYVLLWIIPTLCGVVAICMYLFSFYGLKLNQMGIEKLEKVSLVYGDSGVFPTFVKSITEKLIGYRDAEAPNQNVLATTAESPHIRTVLIATMEYEIVDWQIKIKIGGLGVMSSLMGKTLSHQNLIWVVPCVGDVEYPIDTVGENMIVHVLGKPYEIGVQYHVSDNITYVLLDAPVFRQQTKAEPYPARMDDMDSAIYYSAWNACIAETMKRFPEIDLYHINDYHGALAPLHLLPATIPCALSLHNAEFQGLWSISTPEKLDEISHVFNLDQKIVKKYVQFGEVFNLLHAGASYLRIHQDGFGAVGVSKKYGKRSFARYPIFWGLSKIGALPNPDPSDTGSWDKKLPDIKSVVIDREAESHRGILRQQAQEWAGLTVDPTAELFVFVGRWSHQKGIDVIADVFPAILESNPKTQLICIGPTIDLHGKFAAIKLERLMKMYPDRVYSKPEFTALPPYIFSGAEFALIPSRDEPFGLVAVEFGKKGALGVGARVGGLGNMPGWWFTIESTTTKHMINQFKSAIRGALASDQETRALMRARSTLQRFPVAQWVEDLEILQSTAIKRHKNGEGKGKSRFEPEVELNGMRSGCNSALPSIPHTAANSEPSTRMGSRGGSRSESPSRTPIDSSGKPYGPGHSSILSKRLKSLQLMKKSTSGMSLDSMAGPEGTPTIALWPIPSQDDRGLEMRLGGIDENNTTHQSSGESSDGDSGKNIVAGTLSPPRSGVATPVTPNNGLAERMPLYADYSNRGSTLSINSVVGEGQKFNLQEVDPDFTDPTGIYTRMFERMLENLNSKNSESKLCIEDYLCKSKKNWYGRFHDAKLGRSNTATPASSVYKGKSFIGVRERNAREDSSFDSGESDGGAAQFMLGENYKPPTGIRKALNHKIGDWPVYAILLALGQIIAANSYQITLITGEIGQSASKLYVVASIYLAGSIIWWLLFRRIPSVYCLTLPWFFYGGAFFILGMAPYGTSIVARGWIQNVATGFYALASSSGSLFFALNFGSEGGTPVKSWIFRACVVQGTQQIYVTVLWYWGSNLTRLSAAGTQAESLITYTSKITAITTPIALLLWAVGVLLFLGLPTYYRGTPGAVPSFYQSVYRRKIIIVSFSRSISPSIFADKIHSGSSSSSFFKTTGSPRRMAETGPSCSLRNTRPPGPSGSSLSSFSSESGQGLCTPSPACLVTILGFSPSSPLASAHHAGHRWNGQSLEWASTFRGQAARLLVPLRAGVCGSGSACSTNSRASALA
jgi:alpha-1,3-glucan synthase